MLDTCINNDDKEKMDITDRLFEVVMMIMLRLCEYEVVHKVVWYDSNMKMCRYVDIMPDDNVTGVFFEIYKSHAYTGDNVFLDVFNSQFNVGMFSHVYYVGNECGQSTIYKLVEGKRQQHQRQAGCQVRLVVAVKQLPYFFCFFSYSLIHTIYYTKKAHSTQDIVIH